MSQTAQPSRRVPRQARSAETRRKLLDAGFEAFAAKGYDGVNLVEDVLEPAGISIGSFYHQFADKGELLREILSEAAARRRRFIVQVAELDASSDFHTAIHFVIDRLYDSLESDTAAWRLQRITRVTGAEGVREMGSAARDSWTDELAQLLGRWFGRPVEERRRAADLMVTMARGFMYDFLDTPPELRRDRAEHVGAATEFTVGGIVQLLGAPRDA